MRGQLLTGAFVVPFMGTDVALSYPREHGELVGAVAKCLAARLENKRLFYDGYFEAELARSIAIRLMRSARKISSSTTLSEPASVCRGTFATRKTN